MILPVIRNRVEKIHSRVAAAAVLAADIVDPATSSKAWVAPVPLQPLLLVLR
jgi:hypothetical protein